MVSDDSASRVLESMCMLTRFEDKQSSLKTPVFGVE